MKKTLAIILTLIVAATMISSITVFATSTKTVNYYDENGNQIIINGMYYDSQGYPMYNANCYYVDADGNPIYVGGCRAYYYDENGNLTAGKYYYDENGSAVSHPKSYPGGWGCGTYYYNTQGNIVNGTYYYDDFGNPVDSPKITAPAYRGCCGRR